jgi:hypothetical protein
MSIKPFNFFLSYIEHRKHSLPDYVNKAEVLHRTSMKSMFFSIVPYVSMWFKLKLGKSKTHIK